MTRAKAKSRWSEAEVQIVREREAAGDRPGDMLKYLPARTLTGIYQVRIKLALARQVGKLLAGLNEFVAARHAEELSDGEIAAAWNIVQSNPEAKIDRRCVGDRRVRLRLPAHGPTTQRNRARVASKTREQLDRAGLGTLAEARREAFKARARAAGWPEDLRPRAVQILNLIWDRGPMTRREIAEAIGMPWHGSRGSLKSNDPEGSYLANLMKRGLVVCFERAGTVRGKGKGRSVNIYSLSTHIQRRKVD